MVLRSVVYRSTWTECRAQLLRVCCTLGSIDGSPKSELSHMRCVKLQPQRPSIEYNSIHSTTTVSSTPVQSVVVKHVLDSKLSPVAYQATPDRSHWPAGSFSARGRGNKSPYVQIIYMFLYWGFDNNKTDNLYSYSCCTSSAGQLTQE